MAAQVRFAQLTLMLMYVWNLRIADTAACEFRFVVVYNMAAGRTDVAGAIAKEVHGDLVCGLVVQNLLRGTTPEMKWSSKREQTSSGVRPRLCNTEHGSSWRAAKASLEARISGAEHRVTELAKV